MFYFEGPESLQSYNDSSQEKLKVMLFLERLLLNKFPTFFSEGLGLSVSMYTR